MLISLESPILSNLTFALSRGGARPLSARPKKLRARPPAAARGYAALFTRLRQPITHSENHVSHESTSAFHAGRPLERPPWRRHRRHQHERLRRSLLPDCARELPADRSFPAPQLLVFDVQVDFGRDEGDGLLDNLNFHLGKLLAMFSNHSCAWVR